MTDARSLGPSAGWDVALLATSILTLTLVAVDRQQVVPTATVALALGGCALGWVLLRHRVLRCGRGWVVLLLIVVATCFVGAVTDPVFATFQVIAFPIAWLAAPSIRSAVTATAAIGVAVGIGYAIATGHAGEAALVEGVSFAFNLVMGLWITRISTLSAERGELLTRLTATQEQVVALGRESGAALERERLARDLHDTIAQSLTAIVMLAERAKTRHPEDAALAVLEDAAREALTETRGLVAAGSPVPLEDGLHSAVHLLGDRFSRETGLEVLVRVQAVVPRELEVVLLRCTQEGLANIRKHAHATRVTVTIASDERSVSLTVEDDGVGPGTDPLGTTGFGLAGMRDRVTLVGGTLAIQSGAPSGTRLEVDLPLPGSTAEQRAAAPRVSPAAALLVEREAAQ